MTLPNNFSKVDYHEGIVRTDCDCTNCNKKFVAKLNYDISGEHRIVCPYCCHVHFRIIEKGVVKDVRWTSPRTGPEFVVVETERWWRDDALQMETSSVALHIRNKFLGGDR